MSRIFGRMALCIACVVVNVFFLRVSFAFGWVPAFPGAEGYGKYSIGGRGGKVIKVKNLNDSGPGSFREAVTSSGPRIVVFDVSGIIRLSSQLRIAEPYLTIAGETSPGGIMISGHTTLFNTHDVIVRNMRFRVGSMNVDYQKNANGEIIYYDEVNSYPVAPGSCVGNITTQEAGYPCPLETGVDPEVLDAVDVWGNTVPGGSNDAYNIIFDHCSFSWGVDENFSVSYNARDITVQWCIISEGLSKAGHPKGEHSKGMLISGKNEAVDTTVSLHHNYFVHNFDRNPLVGAGSSYVKVDAVNNVIYNFKGNLSMTTQIKGRANWVHNYVKQGPISNMFAYEAIHIPDGGPLEPLIYSKGNIGCRRFDQSMDEWSVGYMWLDQLLDTSYKKITPWDTPEVTTAEMSIDVADCILSAVGAKAPVRDNVDSRVVNDFSQGTGGLLLNVIYPDGYPIFPNPASSADTDNDGMADEWEVAQGLDTTVDDSSQDKDGDGYTNIENYLHYLSERSYAFDNKCMPSKRGKFFIFR